MRLCMMLVVLAMTMSLLVGCARQEMTITTYPTVESAISTEENGESPLLERLVIELPDFIIRQHVSNMREHFYKDGELIGGIELLDIASQMDTMDNQGYADQALNVMKSVFATEFDYMSESDAYCRAVVSVSSRDGREFYHYFFDGAQMGYDIWMDNAILDSRDMRSCLKTLHSEDLYNPQDQIAVNDAVPLLNLRVKVPDNITRNPKMTTRELFYCGEVLAGGIEQITSQTDLETLGQVTVNLAQELYDGEFSFAGNENESGTNIIAVIRTDSDTTQMVHYITYVGTECYDVWADTSIISEEEALGIAQSCQY